MAVADLPATDFMRGRDAGFPPYNQYRKICGMKVAKDWNDLHDTIDKDVGRNIFITFMKDLYIFSVVVNSV